MKPFLLDKTGREIMVEDVLKIDHFRTKKGRKGLQMKHFTAFILMVIYIGGIILAEGFVLTFLAIIFVPYAFYLFIQHFLQ